MPLNPTEFSEHLIPRGEGNAYARDYAGSGPAFVLMHGFPDNLHIYDDLLPFLVAAGRRVVAFDFLGYGASDKPAGASYGFEQQLGDLEAFRSDTTPAAPQRSISPSIIRTASPPYAFSIPSTPRHLPFGFRN